MNIYNENLKFWLRNEKKLQSDFLCRPYVLKMLGDVNGKTITDIGCGEGYVSRMLASGGAKVVAVDISEKLIQSAQNQEMKDKLGIDYRIESALKLESFQDDSFDTAISVLVYGHFDSQEMRRAVDETRRVLKVGGIFVLAVPHPIAYMVRRSSGWIFFGSQVCNYWKEDDRIYLRNIDLKRFRIDAQKSTVSGYVNTLIMNGFRINEILEPRASKEDMEQFPDMWKDEDKIPYYLIIRAIKE